MSGFEDGLLQNRISANGNGPVRQLKFGDHNWRDMRIRLDLRRVEGVETIRPTKKQLTAITFMVSTDSQK